MQILQPVLFQPNKDILSSLEEVLSEEFNPSSIVIAQPIKQIPEQLLFDNQRKQWKSNEILQWLSDKYNKPISKSTKILAICDFDAYSGNLNFVFGEAQLDGSISAIYLPRLRQEFYGLKSNESVFCQRLVKEAVHELGHSFGLSHCRNIKCVMHFSNSLSDTDIKKVHYLIFAKKHKISTDNKQWPKSPNALSRRLNQIRSNLLEGLGIKVTISRTTTTKDKKSKVNNVTIGIRKIPPVEIKITLKLAIAEACARQSVALAKTQNQPSLH